MVQNAGVRWPVSRLLEHLLALRSLSAVCLKPKLDRNPDSGQFSRMGFLRQTARPSTTLRKYDSKVSESAIKLWQVIKVI